MSEPDLTDPDNPEWTEADFRRARPASEVLPPYIAQALVRKEHSHGLHQALAQQDRLARGGWKLAA